MFQTCRPPKLSKGEFSVTQAMRSLPDFSAEQAFHAASTAFRSLELPGGLSLDSLLKVIEKMRGKRIRVVSTDKLAGTAICGLWLPGRAQEWVFHPPTPWELQRQQFILHELAHMILGHDALPGAGTVLKAGLRGLSPEIVRRALMRTEFRTVEEATAEYLADLLADALRVGPGEPGAFEQVFG